MVGAGCSRSVAAFVTVKVASSATVCCPITPNTGGWFTSVTITVKLFVALAVPSLTTVVNVFVAGPSASVGVHVITPLVDITAPDGGATNEKVRT